MVSHIARVRINRVRLPILLGSADQGKLFFPCPRLRLRIWSRETDSAVPSRVRLLISILRLNLVLLLTGFLPSSAAASIYLFKPPYGIGSVPSYQVTRLRTDGVHCRESTDTGPVNLNIFQTGAALVDYHGPITIRLSFPHPLLV